MSKPEHEKKLTFSPSSSIGEQFALAQPNSHDSSTNSPSSQSSSFTISRGEAGAEKRNPNRVLLDSHGKPYSTDYMFHVAIYQSLSPSEGVAMNILSTQEDIAYLKKQHVLPSTRFV
ncbi:hypothetical protein WA588_005446 [Blastocystis sp. NMH]